MAAGAAAVAVAFWAGLFGLGIAFILSTGCLPTPFGTICPGGAP